MPLAVKADTNEEVKNWISSFKKGYYPQHLNQLVNLILNEAWKNSKATLLQDAIQKENIEFVFDESSKEEINLKNNILTRISSDDLFKFKSTLENFIKNDLEKGAEGLSYNEESTNPLNAIGSKTVSHSSYTQLIQLLFTKTQGQHKLRKKELYLIFTPERVSLGFVKKDDVQGKLLFGISSTNLGSKAIKSYGPTKKLTGNIAVIDIELALILSALSDKITNLNEARNYALDQSAKKAGIQLSKLTHNFKDTNRLVFELNGRPFESAAPSNGQKLIEADFSYVEGASSLSLSELKASYNAYLDNERHKENEKRKALNPSGSIGSFHGWNNVKAFAESFFSNKKDYAPSFSIIRLPITRKCHADPRTVSNDRKDYLRDWSIMGQSNFSWKFSSLEADQLSYCQNNTDLGIDNDDYSSLLPAKSLFLQPIFIELPKNPKNPDTTPTDDEKFEINLQQEKIVKEFAVEFCSQLNMKSVYEIEKLKDNNEVLDFWNELFHNEDQITQLLSKQTKNKVYELVKCISLTNKSKAVLNEENKAKKESPDLRNNSRKDSSSNKTTTFILGK